MPNLSNANTPALKLYSFPLSGHAHRVELCLSLLGLPAEVINLDLRNGEQKQAKFLAMNPFGQVPVLVDGDIVLSDSNAILVYLASQYGDANWLPREPVAAAQVQRFLSIAAGEVFRGPASARMIKLFGANLDWQLAQSTASRLFSILEEHLSRRAYLADIQPQPDANLQTITHPTIADIACYSYIAHAPEGGISLDAYPNLRAWLKRVEALPGFIGMPKTPGALVA